MSVENQTVVSLYVVKLNNGTYFGGFDTDKGQANYVKNPLEAKKFTNKYDIKLRPDEMLVELKVNLAKSDVVMSEPFRPARRRINNR